MKVKRLDIDFMWTSVKSVDTHWVFTENQTVDKVLYEG